VEDTRLQGFTKTARIEVFWHDQRPFEEFRSSAITDRRWWRHTRYPKRWTSKSNARGHPRRLLRV